MEEEQKQHITGVWNGIIAYLIWGVLPLYWKALDGVLPEEILAHRIFWSFSLMVIFLLTFKKWNVFIGDLKQIISKPLSLLSIIMSGVLISGNWFIYIWAVNNDHVLESSLGYYINPLISVLLGIIVLKERLNRMQIISFALAAIGVLVLAVQYGSIPWVALLLALSFGLYGLVKKKANVSSTTGLTVETMVVTPIAIIYLLNLYISGDGQFTNGLLLTDLLLIGAGAATAIPLLLFAEAARRVPLSMIGFLQYIAPTIMLLLGVFVFQEEFTKTHFIAFGFIWLALIIYSISTAKRMKKLQLKRRNPKKVA